ncbi:MAG: hypothetical protein ACOY3Y_13535 [Acidobacteriota bacterium]
MSLADRYQSRPAKSTDFACEHYDALPDGKRCRHYLQGGACARSDEFMCVEWLRANGHAAPSPAPAPAEPAKQPEPKPPAPKVATDLFGNPLPDPPRPAPTKQPPQRAPALHVVRDPAPAEEREPLRGYTTEDIEGFKKLGVEVCLRSEAYGEIWLVPQYTGSDRKELTPEHAATISRVLEAFPGSRVVSFEKSPKQEKEADA